MVDGGDKERNTGVGREVNIIDDRGSLTTGKLNNFRFYTAGQHNRISLKMSSWARGNCILI